MPETQLNVSGNSGGLTGGRRLSSASTDSHPGAALHETGSDWDDWEDEEQQVGVQNTSLYNGAINGASNTMHPLSFLCCLHNWQYW